MALIRLSIFLPVSAEIGIIWSMQICFEASMSWILSETLIRASPIFAMSVLLNAIISPISRFLTILSYISLNNAICSSMSCTLSSDGSNKYRIISGSELMAARAFLSISFCFDRGLSKIPGVSTI